MSPIKHREHLITMLFATWLILGVFVDGFHHNHGDVDSFWTPWHALLYSGFLASALWIFYLVFRTKKQTEQSWKKSIPSGYGLGVLGIFVFLAGGIADMMWHLFLGIEHDVAALLSPSHLTLLVGILLIVTSPFRALWREAGEMQPFTALLSITLTFCMLSFFLWYAWAFINDLSSANALNHYLSVYRSNQLKSVLDGLEKRGVEQTLLTTALLMYPILLSLKRWKIPFGAMTFVFAVETTLMSMLEGFTYVENILLAIIAGVIGDIMIKYARSAAVVAIIVPLVLWSLYFAVVMAKGMAWAPEIWGGSIVLSSIVSFGLYQMSKPSQ
ncbi:hypothetical protein O9H85_22025 [Paenibacillus filicis]|uniref:Uncharacterized protein n=1 Tax=Paenibacillus gyeongsangnamensis TaxID=3388067 RepID=A0ABT4QEE7_9BACL|nr:hypothetical protein [Paenibacillus filicis]MCZ8515050.1 hypothetical protein [Paenibacillus filicis]